jgi:apolipoprotein D and lipocalin family protein
MNARLPRLLVVGAGLLAIAALARAAAADAGVPLRTIPSLDLPRYLGTWYEIAKYPNRFQRQCAGDTMAQYTLLPDQSIEVRNRCRRVDGSVDEAVGAARLNGGPGSPKLKVRFAPAWLSALPFVWGDYWVIDLDPQYQLAAVSEPGRQYLWILSRTPTVSPQAYDALVQRLARQGLDPARLELTPQH